MKLNESLTEAVFFSVPVKVYENRGLSAVVIIDVVVSFIDGVVVQTTTTTTMEIK